MLDIRAQRVNNIKILFTRFVSIRYNIKTVRANLPPVTLYADGDYFDELNKFNKNCLYLFFLHILQCIFTNLVINHEHNTIIHICDEPPI